MKEEKADWEASSATVCISATHEESATFARRRSDGHADKDDRTTQC